MQENNEIINNKLDKGSAVAILNKTYSGIIWNNNATKN